MKAPFILLFILLPSNCLQTEDISNLVRDLIRNENVPSILSAFICWPKLVQLNLLESLKVPIQLRSEFVVQSRISDDSTNKQWYFIDMRCNGSKHFLHTIETAYFAHPYRWIIFQSIGSELKNLTLLPDNNVILVHFNNSLARYDFNQGNFGLN